MGFFKKAKKRFKKATGISFERAALAGMTGGLSEIHGAGSIESFLKDPTGAKAAARERAEALRAAGRVEEAQRLEAEAYRNQILAETEPIRAQGIAELERLSAQQPGETQFFKQGLERGTQAIAAKQAGFGLLDSGSTRRGFGELGGQLLSEEESMRQQGLGRAAQLSQAGYGLGLSALGLEGQSAGRYAQTLANIGDVTAQAQGANRRFFTGLGTQLGGFALGSYLGGGAGGMAGSRAAAPQGGYGSGGLQLGTGYNQFQPPY